MRLRTSHGTRTPDQSSMMSSPLWEMAKMPAVHTFVKVSSLLQSQHQEGSLDDDDDAHSDHMYQSSTTSDSTTCNPTIEDSKNSSFNQALHPPLLGMQSRTASLTPAVAK